MTSASELAHEMGNTTCDILEEFIDWVSNTNQYPTIDTHGDQRTINALEYAIECVREMTPV